MKKQKEQKSIKLIRSLVKEKMDLRYSKDIDLQNIIEPKETQQSSTHDNKEDKAFIVKIDSERIKLELQAIWSSLQPSGDLSGNTLSKVQDQFKLKGDKS